MKLLVVEDDAKIAGAAAARADRGGLPGRGRPGRPRRLWRAREGTYDLILLDVMLPGRNGYRVCADLRQAATRRRSSC